MLILTLILLLLLLLLMTTVPEKQTASIKLSFTSIVAFHSKEIMKKVVTEVFQERDNSKQNTYIVLLRVPKNKCKT